jgi:phosphocarrier protein
MAEQGADAVGLDPAPTAREVITIVNERGLHARASAKFVNAVAKLPEALIIKVSKDGFEANGSSIMGLMMLAAGIGSNIDISAEGPQAAEALDALEALVAARFDEER